MSSLYFDLVVFSKRPRLFYPSSEKINRKKGDGQRNFDASMLNNVSAAATADREP
jgi:hypothetical protein